MDQIHEETYMFVALLLLVGWILWLIFRRYELSTQVRLRRTESFNRLIEKFASAKEFAEFAQTEEGKKMLADPIVPLPNPLTKVLRYLQAGVLSILIGVACFVNAGNGYIAGEAQSEAFYRRMNEYNSYGTLAMLLGGGLILVAGITYVFVHRWHLANGAAKK